MLLSFIRLTADFSCGVRQFREIEQDFYSVLFLATLESVLSKSAEQLLQQQSQQNTRQYEKQFNHSVSYSAMFDYLVELLMDTGTSVEQMLEPLHRVLRTNPTTRRPGRKVSRRKVTEKHKLWFTNTPNE